MTVGVGLRLEVTDGVPAWYDPLAAGQPLLGTGPWLRAMSGRLARRAVTFAARTGPAAGDPADPSGVQAALYGTLQAETRPGEFYDVHHLVVTPTRGLPLAEASRAAREQIAATAPPAASWVPSLVVMFPGYDCFPVGPGAADPAVLDALVSGITAWAGEQGARSTGFLYLRPAAAPLAAALERHGYRPVPLTFSFDLPIPGPDFADYLAALPVKRRAEIGRELRRLAAAGVELCRPPVEEVFEELVRLRCALVRKYRTTVDVDNERAKLRRTVDDVAGGTPELFCAMADGAVLSAGMFAGTDRDWTCVLTGTDYADPRSRFAYFATAYYEPVRAAAPRGVRLLRYGQGSWDAKLARGCRPVRMTAWVHAADPELDAAVAASAAVTDVEL